VELSSGDGLAAKRRVRRVVGAVGLLAGAALAGLGATLPLYRQTYDFGEDGLTFEATLWGTKALAEGADDTVPILYGVPVVVATVLLVVVAALVLAAPRLPARFAAIASVGALAAAAMLTGAVWTVGQLVVAMSGERADGSITVKATAEAGVVALVLACVVALAGGLLAQDWSAALTEPSPEPEGAVVYRLPDDEDDTDTPPLGIPIPEDTGGADR
jgi:hypothetical protein